MGSLKQHLEAVKKEAAEKVSAMVIKSAPLKFVFVHAFLHKPFTPTGMAESRSAIQYVALRRQQIMALDEAEKIVLEEVLRAAPIYFDREIHRTVSPASISPNRWFT